MSANTASGSRFASRPLVGITAADLILRSAYQMGKTPLLPLFAAALGATDLYLGFIVSVSTLTGMVTKPLFGLLSDRWGRRFWLLLGTALFAFVPFFYIGVSTPQQLLLIRLVHGTATAIFGPVTVAYVLEMGKRRRSERVAWFSMARSGGYILGPALGGLLLAFTAPQVVYVLIGILSLGAFFPLLSAGDPGKPRASVPGSWRGELRQAARTAVSSGALWLAGSLEMVMFVGLYAMKAFLPVYGLALGLSTVAIGFYFAAQEGTTVLLKPLAGRIGDRRGHLQPVVGGVVLLGLALILVSATQVVPLFFASALLAGSAQALIAPNTVALLSEQLHADHLGAGVGLLGTLQNGSKVAGPLLAGLLVARFDYRVMFLLMGITLLATVPFLLLAASRRRTSVPYVPAGD